MSGLAGRLPAALALLHRQGAGEPPVGRLCSAFGMLLPPAGAVGTRGTLGRRSGGRRRRLRLGGLFGVGAFFTLPQVLLVAELLLPPLPRPPGLDGQRVGSGLIGLTVQRRQLPHQRLGKADVGHGAHGHAAAAEAAAQRVLIRRQRHAQRAAGAGKGLGAPHRGRRGVLRHEDDAGLFGPGGGAYRLLAHLHAARLQY